MSEPRTAAGAGRRIAITTDWLTSLGGAERVLHELHDMFPEAPIHTSVYDPRRITPDMRDWDVRPSVLQRVPMASRYSRALLPLMPAAFRRFDLSDFDVVVAACSAFAKNVSLRPTTVNLCYCYTPPRYLWGMTQEYVGAGVQRAATALIQWLRQRDLEAAAQVDEFVAISHVVARRIAETYGRPSEVIYPPVNTKAFAPSGRPPENFYLVVSRLVPYKRIDLAIETCNRLGRRLVVVGTGPEEKRLRELAGPTVQLLGRRDDAELSDLYARCRAFLFPGLEDFGIAPVEAQAAGRPVIAFGEGGAGETVVHGETGLHFAEQSVDALAAAIEEVERRTFDPTRCRANAQRFDVGHFREHMARKVAYVRKRCDRIAE